MYQFTIKLVDACNLNCSYCSYFQSAYRPNVKSKLISFEKLEKILLRIRKFSDDKKLTGISILWQGGEPTLAGVKYFKSIAQRMENIFSGIQVLNRVGTNATLIDQHWVDFAREYSFSFNVSIDGDEKTHNMFRRDYSDQGSYANVVAGLRQLIATGLCYQANVVVNTKTSGAEVVALLSGFGVPSIAFQIPESDFQRKSHIGQTEAVARYLKEAFDEWFITPNLRIPMFETLVANCLGVRPPSADCRFTDHCANLMTIETDGSIHTCDVLRNAPEVYQFGEDGEAGSYAKVTQSPAWQKLKSKKLTPKTCLNCNLYYVCKGYCTATRFDSTDGFSKPSVYCNTMLKFLPYVIAKTQLVKTALDQRHPAPKGFKKSEA